MVTEILQLGIKGADLVVQQLQKVQKQKKLTAKAEIVKFGMAAGMSGAAIAGGGGGSSGGGGGSSGGGESSKNQRGRQNEGLRMVADSLAAASTQSSTAFMSSLASTIGGFFGPGGAMVGGMVGSLLSMGDNFADSIDRATQTTAAFWKDRNTISKYTEKGSEQVTSGDFRQQSGQFRFNRNDVTARETAEVVSRIGGTMGRFSSEFMTALKKLVGTNEQRFDLMQSSALAQGNFNALGTDQGFFLQKISDGFSNLPPSIKQKLMPQLFDMVNPDDRSRQLDQGSRATRASFENTAIDAAGQQVTAERVNTALQQRVNTGRGDAALVQASGEITSTMQALMTWLQAHGGGNMGGAQTPRPQPQSQPHTPTGERSRPGG